MYTEWWIGPYKSGEPVTVSHIWGDEAGYLITSILIDEYDFKSDWATYFVTMSRDKAISFNNNINWLFESFSNAFPILRHLLRLTFLEV